MIPLSLLVIAVLDACTLVNQEIANEAPVLESSQIDTMRIGRGGSVTLEVRASDEDDDPLFYTWSAVRLDGPSADTSNVGTFSASSEAFTTWIAPQQIQGSSERFMLSITIRDRLCAIVPSPEERARCEEEAFELVETFIVEVTQRPPALAVPADTAVSFRASSLTLDVFATDEDGDVVEIGWSQLQGPELSFQTQRFGNRGFRLSGVPYYPGNYRFRITATDGSDTVDAEIALLVFPDPEPPSGGMVHLVLPDGGSYEIDTYEYPNQKGSPPLLADSWFAAYQLCAGQGKRLCSRAEWGHACRGEEGNLYSSSDDPSAFGTQPFGRRFCNTAGAEGTGERAPAGAFPNCAGSYGVYDLTGNAREWTGHIDDQGLVVGGISGGSAQDAVSDSCGASVELAPLPPEFDYGDPASADRLGPQYEAYKEGGIGFRCCR